MKLFFRKYGSGPSLIILHGLYGSSDNWITIARMISGRFTVYLPDMRNHGLSPHSEEMNYDAMSSDIFELAEEERLTRFFLAGHSMGGKAAINFALRYPEKLYGLLIADISPFTTEVSEKEAFDQHKKILDSMLSFDPGKIKSRTEAESLLKSRMIPEKTSGFILKNLQRDQENIFRWKLNVPVLLRNLQRITEGLDRNRIDEMKTSGFPVTVLKAADSDYIMKYDYADILRLFPSAEIKEIPDAGHWLHADQPELVAKYITELAGTD